MKLSNKSREVLIWINSYIELNSYPPSRLEIARAFNFNLNAAQYHIERLKEADLIDVTPNVARGIRIK